MTELKAREGLPCPVCKGLSLDWEQIPTRLKKDGAAQYAEIVQCVEEECRFYAEVNHLGTLLPALGLTEDQGDELDPTPWCHACGAVKERQCQCPARYTP